MDILSVRSELRVQAMNRDHWQCRWPKCDPYEGAILQMCHLQQLSQGGTDTLDNVVMLCQFHHDVLDNRTVKGRREAMMTLLREHLRTTGVVA